jgi:type IV secretion system protein VirB1
LRAIIATESRSDPLALNVNGNVQLRSRPATAAQAAAWAEWLITRGYSVDLGLMQVNSRNLATLNLTPAGAFDPCQNLRAGAAILTANYGQAARSVGPGSKALLQAISAYNTGNFHGGFRNG